MCVNKLQQVGITGITAVAIALVGDCATESSRALPVAKVESASVAYSGVRYPMAVG
jgi:hypothetical protein